MGARAFAAGRRMGRLRADLARGLPDRARAWVPHGFAVTWFHPLPALLA